VIALRLVLSLLLLAGIPTAASAEDPDLALGLRQVAEGDFESAIPTLQAVAQRLEGDRARAGERARALLHLGVAQVALDRVDDARLSFQAALVADPLLQATTADFSPKVVRVFQSARAEVKARTAAPKSRRTAWALGGAGVAAAGTAVLLTRDDGGDGVTFANARFGTPVIVCPDGSNNLPLPFTILVDADSASGTMVSSVTATAIIVASAQPAEIGFATSQPARVVPSRIASGHSTIAIETTLTCGNGAGDAPRFNEWTGRVTLTTPTGTATLTTVDLMRVNVP
jgi:hypothetical protein